MFRFFVVVLEIIILVMVLRSPFVQYFFSDMQQSLTTWMTELSMIEERHQLEALRSNISPYTNEMRDFQKEYVLEITESKENLKRFHRLYCVNGDKNPFVHGINLRHICAAIQRSNMLGS